MRFDDDFPRPTHKTDCDICGRKIRSQSLAIGNYFYEGKSENDGVLACDSDCLVVAECEGKMTPCLTAKLPDREKTLAAAREKIAQRQQQAGDLV